MSRSFSCSPVFSTAPLTVRFLSLALLQCKNRTNLSRSRRRISGKEREKRRRTAVTLATLPYSTTFPCELYHYLLRLHLGISALRWNLQLRHRKRKVSLQFEAFPQPLIQEEEEEKAHPSLHLSLWQSRGKRRNKVKLVQLANVELSRKFLDSIVCCNLSFDLDQRWRTYF